MRIAGADESQIESNVGELLNWVGLGKRMTSRPSTLSGGEQQRVAICRAVITKPSLLVADEPTGNVDDHIGVRLVRLFEELNKTGTTVVLATHNRALIDRFDHPRMTLRDGELLMPTASVRGE